MLMRLLALQDHFKLLLKVKPLPDVYGRRTRLLRPFEGTDTGKANSRVGLLYDINAASAVPAVSDCADRVGEAFARYTGQQEPASDVLSRVSCLTPCVDTLLLYREKCAVVT